MFEKFISAIAGDEKRIERGSAAKDDSVDRPLLKCDGDRVRDWMHKQKDRRARIGCSPRCAERARLRLPLGRGNECVEDEQQNDRLSTGLVLSAACIY